MNWRLAESLKTLRTQVDALWPNRDKTSDGSIGDTAHSQRVSDHNPNSAGVVTAIDIDRELGGQPDGSRSGGTVQILVDKLQASRDPRIKYLIYSGRITKHGDISQWQPYHGANAHKHHMHISVSSDSSLYDDAREWNLGAVVISTTEKTHIVVPGDTLWALASKYQISVSEIRHLNGLTSDLIKVGQTLKMG